MTQRIRRFLSNRSHMRNRRDVGDEGAEISLLDIMRRAIDCTTLKVTKQNGSKVKLEEAIDSFSLTTDV